METLISDTIGTTAMCLEYKSVHSSKASGILAMCNCAVEHYEAILRSSLLLCGGDKGSPEASSMRNSAIISSGPCNTHVHQKQLKEINTVPIVIPEGCTNTI